jgi:polysaccharide biosynthesis protein PslH
MGVVAACATSVHAVVQILFATTVLPAGRGSGGEVVSAALVDALRAAGHDVTVLGFVRPGPSALRAGPQSVAVAARPIETAAAPQGTKARWLLRALVTNRGFSEAKYVSRAYREELEARPAPDLTIIDHAQLAWLARHVRSPFVHVAHNVEQALYAEAAREAGRPWSKALWAREAARLGAAEAALARDAAAVWTLSRADAAAFAPHARGPVVALSVPPTGEAPGARARDGGGAAAGDGGRAATAEPDPLAAGAVALLGTWTWGPNLAGLRWFEEEVVPHLAPGVRVLVGGRRDEAAAPPPPRVTALGFVDDAAAFLAGAGVIAVPATAGAGVQIKTLDAIAAGPPVVVTPLALRGIDDVPDSVRVADDPRGFAHALTEALQAPHDPETGRAWARERRERFAAQVAEAAQAAAARR